MAAARKRKSKRLTTRRRVYLQRMKIRKNKGFRRIMNKS